MEKFLCGEILVSAQRSSLASREKDVRVILPATSCGESQVDSESPRDSFRAIDRTYCQARAGSISVPFPTGVPGIFPKSKFSKDLRVSKGRTSSVLRWQRVCVSLRIVFHDGALPGEFGTDVKSNDRLNAGELGVWEAFRRANRGRASAIDVDRSA
jgi:hypothetical protein